VAAVDDLLGLTLRDWLHGLAARGPAPGGGSAAALTAATAASLVAMTARVSTRSWPDAAGVVAQAEALCARLAGLAQADAELYSNSLERLARVEDVPDDRRDFELGEALSNAAAPPLAIAESAADVALLAGEAADRGDPKVRADAEAATALAAAAAQAAARLVEVNLVTLPADPRIEKAKAAAETAASAARRTYRQS
jgi:formiminotetrahydrofolate cyclodeaminase